MKRISKKKPEELSLPIKEIPMSEKDWNELNEGIKLFNEGKYWHAHEAWEKIWLRHTEDERLFFQGIIQLAAAHHHRITRKSFSGMKNNFAKALNKLLPFSSGYLRIDIASLIEEIESTLEKIDEIGEHWETKKPEIHIVS